jgi:hypothetical protein
MRITAGFSRGPRGIVKMAVLAALLSTLASAHAASSEGPGASAVNLGTPTPAAGQEPWDTALGAIGLTRETFGFDYADMSNYGGDKYVVPLFYVLQGNPFKIEPYAKSFRADLLAGCATLAGPVAFGERRVDEAVRRGLIADPIAPVVARVSRPEPLFAAVRDFQAFYGSTLQPYQQARLRREAAEVPLAVQQMAALVIYFGIDSTGYHREAFRKAAREFDLEAMFGKMQAVFATDQDIVDLELERFIDAVDFKYLYTQSQELAMAVDFAADSLARLSTTAVFDFRWPTPVGEIVLRGASDDDYPADDYFLIIDTGGNDFYANAAANQSISNWMSILVDLAGDDTYLAGPADGPAFGAGIFGYAYLVDASGDDTYSGKNLTQGVGLFGVGALLDKAGDDTYDAYTLNQGTGVFGVGTLSDLAGNDYYHTWQQGQGYGFTKGCGVLVDRSGNDRYVAEDSILAFPGQQTKEHNSSLAQGVGFGKRADYIDGHSWAGGLGFLIDGAGDDTYSAGLFAQGCAYWYAVGVLSDVSGNDLYDAVWYVQGSGAHFALGLLLDSAGDDHYRASMNMAQGAGHDFTLGYLIDEAGDDVYDAPYLSLGGGNANGIGIFWDKCGNDRYNSTAALTLGRSNTMSRGGLRDYINTIGIFLDTGGLDAYPLAYPDSADLFLNNTIWTRPGIIADPKLATEKGVGYDCEGR